MNQLIYFFCLIILFVGCQTTPESIDEVSGELAEVPASYVNVRVNFPIKELEEGVNASLPALLVDDAFPMKDDQDTLYLKIIRKGKLKLRVSNNKVFASIPLELHGSIRKKVLGLTVSNRDRPVSVSGTVHATTELHLQDNWNLGYTCRWEQLELDQEPQIALMGFKLNLGSTIDHVVDEYRDNLSDVICRTLNNSFSLKKVLNKVWQDLQSSKRIAKNPKPLYLRSNPIALNGLLVPQNEDTLSILLEYRTKIQISPENRKVVHPSKLTQKGTPLSDHSKILAYPEIKITYEQLEQVLSAQLLTKKISYEGYQLEITEVAVTRADHLLAITLGTKGDLEGSILIKGHPVLNDQMELSIGNFNYKINGDNPLVTISDMVLKPLVEAYVPNLLKIDIGPYFDGLDELIVGKLSEAPLGKKLDLRLSLDNVRSYSLALTENEMQWILFVEGNARLNLKGGLLKH